MKKKIKKPEPWYERLGGVLHAEKHAVLIADKAEMAADAPIPGKLIWRSMPSLPTKVRRQAGALDTRSFWKRLPSAQSIPTTHFEP